MKKTKSSSSSSSSWPVSSLTPTIYVIVNNEFLTSEKKNHIENINSIFHHCIRSFVCVCRKFIFHFEIKEEKTRPKDEIKMIWLTGKKNCFTVSNQIKKKKYLDLDWYIIKGRRWSYFWPSHSPISSWMNGQNEKKETKKTTKNLI